jgi:hypothetical protein
MINKTNLHKVNTFNFHINEKKIISCKFSFTGATRHFDTGYFFEDTETKKVFLVLGLTDYRAYNKIMVDFLQEADLLIPLHKFKITELTYKNNKPCNIKSKDAN